MAKKSSVTLPEGMTQKQIVEEFLNNGVEKPADIFEAVKQKYGIEIPKPSINQVKVVWKKSREAVLPKPKHGPKPTPSLFNDPVPSTPPATAPQAPIPLFTKPSSPDVAPAVQTSQASSGTVSIEIAKLVLKFGSVDAAIAELEKLR